MPTIKAVIPMADYGHDPTETAVPFTRWTAAGISVTIATETGKTPTCDTLMLEGTVQKFLGATAAVIDMYRAMEQHPAMRNPVSWTDPSFSLDDYDIVFLPGGHDKGMRQIIDSPSLHVHLSSFWPKTLKPPPSTFPSSPTAPPKIIAAICHGVMVLSRTPVSPSPSTPSPTTQQSILHASLTTTLPTYLENTAYTLTRFFLGPYYKTYGAAAPSTESSVRAALDDDGRQWRTSWNPARPFVVEDEGRWYFSGRFPGDAEELARRVAAAVGVGW